MDTIRLEHPTCRFIAHRGVSGLERENTAAAFVAAGNRSFYGIETDVHRTADGRYIIFHDDTTGRLAPLDLPVEQSTEAQLRELRLSDAAGHTRGDLCLPTLAEYLRICRHYDKVGVLELKNAFAPADIREIVSVIEQEYAVDRMVLISFCYENLVVLRQLLPQAHLQFLYNGPVDEELCQRLLRYRLNLDIHYPCLSEEAVAFLHAHDIQVNCWTVNDPTAAAHLVEWGVDFVTTNILE